MFVIVLFSKQHNLRALIFKVLNLTLTIVFFSDTIKQRYAIVNMLQSKRFVFYWTSNTLILGIFTILQNYCFVWSTVFPFVDFSIRKILFLAVVYTDTDGSRYLPLSNIWTNGIFRYTLVFPLHIMYVFSVFMFFIHVDFFGITDIK